MSTKTVMKKSLIATAVAGAMSVSMLPATASAEISGSLGIDSQYLWRGLALNGGGAVVHGGLEYGHDSGFYTGIWTSSEAGVIEYDLYAGFAGEAGEISYDLGVAQYRYSAGGTVRAQFNDDDEFTGFAENARKGADFQEFYIGLGFGNFGLDAAFGFGKFGQTDEDVKDNYFALSYAYDKFGILLGYYDLEDFEADVDGDVVKIDPSYMHLDLSYEIYDGLTFTYSQIIDEEEDGFWDKSSTFMVSYEFSF
jgi:uncharacterized protein (TIGR02001 family)